MSQMNFEKEPFLADEEKTVSIPQRTTTKCCRKDGRCLLSFVLFLTIITSIVTLVFLCLPYSVHLHESGVRSMELKPAHAAMELRVPGSETEHRQHGEEPYITKHLFHPFLLASVIIASLGIAVSALSFLLTVCGKPRGLILTFIFHLVAIIAFFCIVLMEGADLGHTLKDAPDHTCFRISKSFLLVILFACVTSFLNVLLLPLITLHMVKSRMMNRVQSLEAEIDTLRMVPTLDSKEPMTL
jgi:hypothetical protein